jgi:hypothetical protein
MTDPADPGEPVEPPPNAVDRDATLAVETVTGYLSGQPSGYLTEWLVSVRQQMSDALEGSGAEQAAALAQRYADDGWLAAEVTREAYSKLDRAALVKMVKLVMQVSGEQQRRSHVAQAEVNAMAQVRATATVIPGPASGAAQALDARVIVSDDTLTLDVDEILRQAAAPNGVATLSWIKAVVVVLLFLVLAGAGSAESMLPSKAQQFAANETNNIALALGIVALIRPGDKPQG